MQIRIARPRPIHVLVATTIVALLVAACAAPAGQAPAAAQEIRVVTTEWKFAPATIHVPVGQPFTLILENRGAIEHDLHVEELDILLYATAGQTVQGTFTVDKPGTYVIECSLPGHTEAGMKGTLVVGDGAADTAPAAQPVAAPGQASARPLPADLDLLPLAEMAPPLPERGPTLVKAEIDAVELTALVDDGVAHKFWTFGGTIPGPMLRVREGDTVELTFRNAPDSVVTHSIDLHAVTGPGGGAAVTQVGPGEEATFRFQALNPGVYVYHCATPIVAHHISAGMYGLIVVEPAEGLPKVDREFYVMQGDLYLQGDRGEQGLRDFSVEKMLDERPDYVLFNGGVGSLAGERALKANVGETVRIFFGVGGPNLTSSFHVIGEIFDRVHPEGASQALSNVQTTLVPAGGATMVEFTVDVPGRYILVDHSLSRLEKGAAAILEVEGPENTAIFESISGSGQPAPGH